MATVRVIRFKSKTLADGTNPVYIRVSYKNKNRFFPVYKNDKRFRTFEQQWDESKDRFKSNKKINPEYNILNEILRKRENKIRDIIQEYTDKEIAWHFDMLSRRFYNDRTVTYVFDYLRQQLDKSKGVDKHNYQTIEKDLVDFNNNKPLIFSEINYDFVNEFIDYQKDHKRNNTTIGLRLRYLRKLLNAAIKDGVGSRESYPFSTKYGATQIIKISKYEKVERKIAVNEDLIEQIKNTEFKNKKTEIARRIFLSSYAGRGMNFRDMAVMLESNIYEADGAKWINYTRGKSDSQVNFRISPLLQEQLDWFKTYCHLLPGHLFPIIEDRKVEDLRKYLDNKLNIYNYHLKKISPNASSYVPRHTFATHAFYAGVDVNDISQELSHQNTKTTQRYLKRLVKDELQDKFESITG